ncbi:MAG: hypothetical protein QOG48_811 [Verrucomicrobiota bacterium]|jgi:uncharacterized protein YkwD
MHRFAALVLLSILPASLASAAASENDSVSAAALVREMNFARENPAAYAQYIEDMRATFNGRCYVLPGQTRVFTKEGVYALDDAIRFLKHARPLQPLTLSLGMSKGAADHCADQSSGGFSHGGRDGSNPGMRMSRYGSWGASWGENIAYGKRTARDIVIALIIDDGQTARKHRKNIFNASFNFAGAAYGPHAKFGSVCTTDFAGAYNERNQTAALVAANSSER